MIITIAGKPGSGKTTVAKHIANKLGYKHLSGGDFRGQIAIKHGITIDDLNKIAEKEIWTDKEIDDELVKISKSNENYVIDSWTAFHFIPNSIKIFLDVDDDVGAMRVFNHPREDEDEKSSVGEVKEMLQNRLKKTTQRFLKYYDFNFLDMNHFDLVLDTTNINLDEVVKEILNFVKNHKK